MRGGTSAKMRTRSRIHLATNESIKETHQSQSLQESLIFGMPLYSSVRFIVVAVTPTVLLLSR